MLVSGCFVCFVVVFVCPQEGVLLVNSLEHYTRHQTPLQGLLAVVILLYLHPKGVLIAPLCGCHGVGLHPRGQHHGKRRACFPFQAGAERRRRGQTTAFCWRAVCFAVLFFSKHAEGYFSALTCTFELFCAILGNRRKTRWRPGFSRAVRNVATMAHQRTLKQMEHQSGYRCQLFCNHVLFVNMQIRRVLLSISVPPRQLLRQRFPNEWINTLD